MIIESNRLRLVPVSPEYLLVLIEEPDQFVHRFGTPAASGLREFFASDDVSPEFVAGLRQAEPLADPWQFGFLVVDRGSEMVVGTGGFKGPPDGKGMVEIAYGIVSSFEGKGYATEVACELVAFAQSDSRVQNICAHTLPQVNASTRVLEKNGFVKTGEVEDPDDGLVWRWELK